MVNLLGLDAAAGLTLEAEAGRSVWLEDAP
jgi:hypothetical protein